MRITRTIRDGSFFANPSLCGAVDHAKKNGGRLHVMGLCSSAGVHSSPEHAYAVMELAHRRGLTGEAVLFHALGMVETRRRISASSSSRRSRRGCAKSGPPAFVSIGA